MKKIILWALAVVAALAILIQLIPVSKTNPAVTQEVRWDSPLTRDLTKRACFDCHSNETVWPWYARVAPVSLILANHVNEGRQRLNFSEWNRPNSEYEDVAETIQEGEMPLWDYLLMHPEAKLSASEKEALLSGLQATFLNDPPIDRKGRSDD